MNEHKDSYGSKVEKGDIIYFGEGSYANCHFAVISNIGKSYGVLSVRRGYRNEEKWLAVETHIMFGARTMLKMKPEWIATLDDQELSRVLLNARGRVLAGEYDEKPKKPKKVKANG